MNASRPVETAPRVAGKWLAPITKRMDIYPRYLLFAVLALALAAWGEEARLPRWLYVLPNGDVLVAETNAPPKPEDGNSIKDWITEWVMNEAGADVPSVNRITLLRDADGDGVAEIRSTFIEGLNSPFARPWLNWIRSKAGMRNIS